MDNIATIEDEVGLKSTTNQFIRANTINMDLREIQEKHVIPVFSKLNEPLISHYDFVQTTLEVLQKYKLEDVLKEKFVFGESVAQTSQFIISKVVEVGFTAKSVVMAENMRGKGNWQELDENSYSPITQGIVVINNRKLKRKDAQQFYDFLFTPKGKEILNKFGYSVPN